MPSNRTRGAQMYKLW
nr:unnamed protein product [Callosobruchus chinensis]